MRAAILYGKEDVRVEDVAAAPLSQGEVRIRIEAALTCGTDLKVFKRGYHAKMIVPPAVFGHELAGTISETHPAAATDTGGGWRVGERVVVANSAPCGCCFFCGQGQENLCDDLLFLNGAYAESITVPARIVEKNLLRIRGATEFQDAALAEPLACVVQGVEETGLRTGQRVLVMGAGPIGLMFVALANSLGCEVSVVGRGEKRLETARRLGARQVWDASAPRSARDGVPSGLVFDAVIEAIGKPETWETAVRLVRKGGTVNFFGGCRSGTSITLKTELIHYSNLKLLASFHHTPRTFRRALEYIEAGLIRARDFVDGECALSALPGLLMSMAKGNRAVKTLIRVEQ